MHLCVQGEGRNHTPDDSVPLSCAYISHCQAVSCAHNRVRPARPDCERDSGNSLTELERGVVAPAVTWI